MRKISFAITILSLLFSQIANSAEYPTDHSYYPDRACTWLYPHTTSYVVTSSYGVRIRENSAKKTVSYPMHNGIDIGAPGGANVYAPQSGVVSFSDWHGGAGYTVRIYDRERNVSSHLFHLSKPSHLKKGDHVKAGDLVGYVGKTGGNYGNHTHFEAAFSENPSITRSVPPSLYTCAQGSGKFNAPDTSNLFTGNRIRKTVQNKYNGSIDAWWFDTKARKGWTNGNNRIIATNESNNNIGSNPNEEIPEDKALNSEIGNTLWGSNATGFDEIPLNTDTSSLAAWLTEVAQRKLTPNFLQDISAAKQPRLYAELTYIEAAHEMTSVVMTRIISRTEAIKAARLSLSLDSLRDDLHSSSRTAKSQSKAP